MVALSDFPYFNNNNDTDNDNNHNNSALFGLLKKWPVYKQYPEATSGLYTCATDCSSLGNARKCQVPCQHLIFCVTNEQGLQGVSPVKKGLQPFGFPGFPDAKYRNMFQGMMFVEDPFLWIHGTIVQCKHHHLETMLWDGVGITQTIHGTSIFTY